MSTTLHVGRHLIQTTADGLGSPIPPGTLTATVAPIGFVTALVTGSNNSVRLDGVAVGTATVTYKAVGYTDAQDIVTVLTPPQIIVTDGPEI